MSTIIHNKKFEIGEQIDCFKVTAPLPFAGGVATFGESEVVDLPRIDWGEGIMVPLSRPLREILS